MIYPRYTGAFGCVWVLLGPSGCHCFGCLCAGHLPSGVSAGYLSGAVGCVCVWVPSFGCVCVLFWVLPSGFRVFRVFPGASGSFRVLSGVSGCFRVLRRAGFPRKARTKIIENPQFWEKQPWQSG